MKLLEENFDLDNLIIVPLGDCHYGAKQFNERQFDNMLNYIESHDNVRVVLMGDLINNGLKNSKTNIYEEICSPIEQIRYMKRKLFPIKDKIIAATSGNHEERTFKDTGMDISNEIADYLNVPYDMYGMTVNLKISTNEDKKQNYVLYMTHGSGGGVTKGAKINRLYNLRNIILADIYCMGHLHETMTTKDVYFVPDTRHSALKKQTRTFVMCGSTLDWGGYSERLMLTPSSVDFPLIYASGNRKEVRVLI